MDGVGWPASPEGLLTIQDTLGREAERARLVRPFALVEGGRLGGCFVAFARGEAGPGHPGDHAWAAAAVWIAGRSGAVRNPGRELRGVHAVSRPRQAHDVLGQAVVASSVPAAYRRGLLALREGPILEEAVRALAPARPDVLLVDATGADHPRRAGLAVHLGAVLDLPTVGVTHRPLVARGDPPAQPVRGATAPLFIDGDLVAVWVCTSTGSRPVVVHAGWRTDVEAARAVVMAASTEGSRTPVPLQEARRVAREARSLSYQ